MNFKIFTLTALGLFITACSQQGSLFDRTTAISLGSGAAGALACNQIFDDSGSRGTWTALCGAGGYFLGRSYALNTSKSLETSRIGQTTSWDDPDTGRVTMTPTRTYYNSYNAPCRDYEQTVTMDGNPQVINGSACRQPDGTWQHQEMSKQNYNNSYPTQNSGGSYY